MSVRLSVLSAFDPLIFLHIKTRRGINLFFPWPFHLLIRCCTNQTTNEGSLNTALVIRQAKLPARMNVQAAAMTARGSTNNIRKEIKPNDDDIFLFCLHLWLTVDLWSAVSLSPHLHRLCLPISILPFCESLFSWMNQRRFFQLNTKWIPPCFVWLILLIRWLTIWLTDPGHVLVRTYVHIRISSIVRVKMNDANPTTMLANG